MKFIKFSNSITKYVQFDPVQRILINLIGEIKSKTKRKHITVEKSKNLRIRGNIYTLQLHGHQRKPKIETIIKFKQS